MNLRLVSFIHYAKHKLPNRLEEVLSNSNLSKDEKKQKAFEILIEFKLEVEKESNMTLIEAFYLPTIDSLEFIISHWIVGFIIGFSEKKIDYEEFLLEIPEGLVTVKLKEEINKLWNDFNKVIRKESIRKFIVSGKEALKTIVKSMTVYNMIPVIGTYLLTKAWLLKYEGLTNSRVDEIAEVWNRMYNSGHKEQGVASIISSYFVKIAREVTGANSKLKLNLTYKRPLRDMAMLICSVNEERNFNFEEIFGKLNNDHIVGNIDVLDAWFLSTIEKRGFKNLDNTNEVASETLKLRKDFIRKGLKEVKNEINNITYEDIDKFNSDFYNNIIVNIFNEYILGQEARIDKKWVFALCFLKDIYETSRKKPLPIIPEEEFSRKASEYLLLYSKWTSYEVETKLNKFKEEIIFIKKDKVIEREIKLNKSAYKNFLLSKALNVKNDNNDLLINIINRNPIILRLLRNKQTIEDQVLSGTDFSIYRIFLSEYLSISKHIKKTTIMNSKAENPLEVFRKKILLQHTNSKIKDANSLNALLKEIRHENNSQINSFRIIAIDYLLEIKKRELPDTFKIANELPILVFDFGNFENDPENKYSSFNNLFNNFLDAIKDATKKDPKLKHNELINVNKEDLFDSGNIQKVYDLISDIEDLSLLKNKITTSSINTQKKNQLLFDCSVLNYSIRVLRKKLNEITQNIEDIKTDKKIDSDESNIIRKTGEVVATFYSGNHKLSDRDELEKYPLYLGVEEWAHDRWVFLDKVNIWVQLPFILLLTLVFNQNLVEISKINIDWWWLGILLPSLFLLCIIELSFRLSKYKNSEGDILNIECVYKDYRLILEFTVFALIAILITSLIDAIISHSYYLINVVYCLATMTIFSQIVPIISSRKKIEQKKNKENNKVLSRSKIFTLSILAIIVTWSFTLYHFPEAISSIIKGLIAAIFSVIILISLSLFPEIKDRNDIKKLVLPLRIINYITYYVRIYINCFVIFLRRIISFVVRNIMSLKNLIETSLMQLLKSLRRILKLSLTKKI